MGLCISNEKTLPSFNFEGLPLTSDSRSPYVMYSSSPLPFTWLRVEGLDHWRLEKIRLFSIKTINLKFGFFF